MVQPVWTKYVQCQLKNLPPCSCLESFTQNGLESLIRILHSYYTFKFTLNYKILFSYLQLWQSYAILRTTTPWIFTFHQIEGKLYWLHRKRPLATKFTRPQPTWLPSMGCNASGISQTYFTQAKDHSKTKKMHCSRSGMTCRRQRSTKLLMNFMNVCRLSTCVSVDGDILSIWCELCTEIF